MTGTAAVSGRGRKPKPTAVKKRQGNPGKRKLNENEPTFSELSINTPPPEDLNEHGITMWHFLLRELVPQGIVFKTDLETVANYCIAYQNRRMAQDGIKQHGLYIANGNGGLSKNPAFTVIKEAMNDMSKFGAMLGLDPSSRTRLIGNADKQTANPFAELLQ